MTLLQQYPELAAIFIVGVGFLVSHYLARWSGAGIRLLENSLRQVAPQRAGLSADVERALSRTIYYTVLGLFMLLAIRSLGFEVLGQWLDSVIIYVPQVLLGAAIIFGGYVLGIVVRGLVANIVAPGTSRLLPRLAQYLVVIAAVITGLAQMAIDVSFLATVTLLVIGAMLGGLSLAFALGAREVVANMLSRRELDRYQVGDRLRIDDAEGRIVELSRTGVLLEGPDGLTYVPASRFASSIVILLGTSEAGDD